MQFYKVVLLAVLAAFAIIGTAHGQGQARGGGEGVAGDKEEPQTGTELEVAKMEAVREGEEFSVGDEIVEAADLVITEDSEDDDVVAIAEDPDTIAEEERREVGESCCPRGTTCCGLELGCVPVTLTTPDIIVSEDVSCAVAIGPDSPQRPCCQRKLQAAEAIFPQAAKK